MNVTDSRQRTVPVTCSIRRRTISSGAVTGRAVTLHTTGTAGGLIVTPRKASAIAPAAGRISAQWNGAETGSISAGHARALLALASEKAQVDLAKSAAAHGWSVRELEERVRRFTAGKAPRQRKAPKRAFSSELMGLEDDLMRALGTRVRVTRRRGGTGSIYIDYHSEEELDRLVNVLRSLAAEAR